MQYFEHIINSMSQDQVKAFKEYVQEAERYQQQQQANN